MTTRTVLRLGAALALVLAAAHVGAGPASAECTFVPPIPKAEPAIRSADEVIIGTLVRASPGDLDLGPNQGPREIALRVIEVLRGPKAVGDLLDVQYLEPNWPWTKYRNGNGQAIPSCSYLFTDAKVGDTIALALGAVQPRQRLEAPGVSWVQPRTTYNGMSKIKTSAKLGEIRRLARLPETDVAPAVAPPGNAEGDVRWLLALALGLAGGAIAWRRTGRRGVSSFGSDPERLPIPAFGSRGGEGIEGRTRNVSD